MPYAKIRGVELHYKVVGTQGPWFALTPGGRRSFAEFEVLAEKIASAGFRVVLHDRRNCGHSGIAFDDTDAEDGIWTEDLHALLTQLGALPAFIGGSSSGCRLSLLFYLRHPADVKGLLLFRVTGGDFAGERLPKNYYDQFLAAAQTGGMDAVANTDHWRERSALRPEDRADLLAVPVDRFLKVMSAWRARFVEGVDLPVLGVSAAELGSVEVPTLVIPGNDRIHSGPIGRHTATLIPGAVLHELPISDTERDLIPYEEWAPYEDEIATTFAQFMRAHA